MNDEKRNPVLKVENLSISFDRYDGGWEMNNLKVIDSLDASVYKGEILAIVGGSGSGKSLLAHSILGLLPENSKVTGNIEFCGESLTDNRKKELRGKDIVLIPQSVDFLDPLMKVGKQVAGVKKDKNKMREVFRRYDLDESVEKLYPFQLSGGMARRVLIATAVMETPRLIVADEPTPGLDLGLARETLNHFRELADNGCAVILITHDVDLALEVADRIAVFYAGTTVEVADADDFRKGKEHLRHPYSKAFFDALPQNGFNSLSGRQPYAGTHSSGCIFVDRCLNRTTSCSCDIQMRNVRGGEVRCVNAT